MRKRIGWATRRWATSTVMLAALTGYSIARLVPDGNTWVAVGVLVLMVAFFLIYMGVIQVEEEERSTLKTIERTQAEQEAYERRARGGR